MKYALLIILAIGLFDEVYAQSDISDSVYYEVGKQLPIEKISQTRHDVLVSFISTLVFSLMQMPNTDLNSRIPHNSL